MRGGGLGRERELSKWEGAKRFPLSRREHLRAVTVPSSLIMGTQPQKGDVRKRPLCSFFSRLGVGSSKCEPQTFCLMVGVRK